LKDKYEDTKREKVRRINNKRKDDEDSGGGKYKISTKKEDEVEEDKKGEILDYFQDFINESKCPLKNDIKKFTRQIFADFLDKH
jgi:hypothetical protein